MLLLSFFSPSNEISSYIRVDTISQLLTSANIYSSSRVLVAENTQGMIISSLLSRVTDGLVFGLFEGGGANYDILKISNFTESLEKKVFHSLSWQKIDHQIEPFTEELGENHTENDVKGRDRRLRNHNALKETLETLRSAPFDSLVVSTSYDPLSVIKKLVPYVGGSRAVVIYSPYKETLLESFEYMRMSSEFLNVSLQESWMREYQVLPGRTHPMMNMTSSGGYLLTAIRVFASNEPRQTPSKKSRS
ncbi:tRNA (adenine(58)-N(1))-methyltransferase non-catalytic subunit TRM6 [Smittium culicis]|uniref:tRNA (adenine(58)-N(1))-methyltransferase non-catalytic subunit TRM6 n=1 Tax=Smittium culicis TaxID=133412 RepID=A0A1R1YAQ2_9FUNG|nr:tRNA (adenine(58)-N(1))-methyltransferase non-catalytic subunit TRM6 [Smittium culicis]